MLGSKDHLSVFLPQSMGVWYPHLLQWPKTSKKDITKGTLYLQLGPELQAVS